MTARKYDEKTTVSWLETVAFLSINTPDHTYLLQVNRSIQPRSVCLQTNA